MREEFVFGAQSDAVPIRPGIALQAVMDQTDFSLIISTGKQIRGKNRQTLQKAVKILADTGTSSCCEAPPPFRLKPQDKAKPKDWADNEGKLFPTCSKQHGSAQKTDDGGEP